MEKKLLLFCRRLDEGLPASFQRRRVRSDDPGAAGHDTGTVIDEQILEFWKRRPGTPRCRQERCSPVTRALRPGFTLQPQSAERLELLLTVAGCQPVEHHARRDIG